MKSMGFTRKQILVLGCVWLAFMVSFVVRLSWSSIMPIAMPALHFTVAEGAKYISAFYLGYLLTVLPGGMLADRFGYRRAILTCLGLMALFTLPMAWVDSFYSGLALRFGLGIVCGPLHASCLSAIGDYFTAKQRGKAVGLYMTASSFGVSFVNSWAPFVAQTYGWQATFLVAALIPVAILFLCSRGIQQKIHDAEASKVIAKRELTLGASLRKVATRRNIWLLALTGLLATGTTWGTTTWANLFLHKEMGIPAVQAGQIMVIFGLAAMVAKPLSGFLADSISMRLSHLAALLLAFLCPALCLFVWTPSPSWLYGTGAILGIGAFSYSALTNTLAIMVAPEGLRGTTVGFINVFNQIGSFSAPLLLSQVVMTTGSYADSMLLLAIAPLLGALLLLNVKKDWE